MALYDKPNVLSLIILGIVVLIAATFGFVTYTQKPETAHFTVAEGFQFNYDFARIDKLVDLDSDLDEISGMAWDEGDNLYGIQDEDGLLYRIASQTGVSEEIFQFSKDRDYEGIARTDTAIYVLEQDGDLFRIPLPIPTDKDFEADKYETDFGYKNNTEGICYDPKTEALLIVPKEEELDPDDMGSRRGIYLFDITARRLEPQPEYYIDEYELGQAIYGKMSRYQFKPSGIAVDPITDNIYVLGHIGKVLIVINRESQIQQVEILDDRVFKQPEGLTFNAAGDLFISSEGRGGNAILATFRRQTVDNPPKDNPENERQ